MSNTFRREITKTITKSFLNVAARVVFTTKAAFSGRQKDVLPTTSKSNLIYEFTCCCGQAYVGKTTQCLSERIKQHIPAKILTDPPVLKKNKADSAITRHLKESTACLQPDVTKKFKILAQARHQRHLDVLEAIFIKNKKPTLCNQKEHVRALSLLH